MKKIFLFLFSIALFSTNFLQAQVTEPVITSWILNNNGHTVSGILTDVESVYYDNNFVYVKASSVPSYYNFNNPNVNDASDGDFTWKITRSPQKNTGTPTSALGGGQYGVFIDGTTIFNAEDARSYQNDGIWHQLAYVFEKPDFDSTWGHSTPTKNYHHHVVNLAYVDTSTSTIHSPLIGFMFDGYPVYGPFGYSDANDAGSPVVFMTSSYAYRNIANRTTLPDGTVLQPSQYGPAINQQYKLGSYREDFVYTSGSGSLDEHNGRFCKTPEYPNGIYAYFCTMDSNLEARYPYTVGQSLYGVITTGNQGPGGGKATIPGNATLYVPTVSSVSDINSFDWMLFPNPAKDALFIKTNNTYNYSFTLTAMDGKILLRQNLNQQVEQVDVSMLPAGSYIITVTDNATGKKSVNRCVKL